MELDDTICYCFHITKRKIINYIRIHEPRVASQISGCGGAGTGCGWCVPFLRQLFEQGQSNDLEQLNADDYAKRRADYIRAGHGTPPPGASD